MDDSVRDVTVFTKNRERLLDGEIAVKRFTTQSKPGRVHITRGTEEAFRNITDGSNVSELRTVAGFLNSV